ncbi:cupin domain-containing protein [Candidatus Soleaferrea massiliensis]|uniref:cupin domain-containing protein n=1 Tax=Candidatus Soleaferrea massiliensis TaxID=1470354 RepID=UPI00058BEA2C|nr:cupin domain-containing protein [Candidatus Soleaferrea massiliensis]
MPYGQKIDAYQNPKEDFGDSEIYRAVQTDQIGCGLLKLEPGGTAGYDAGHQNADEVFYIVKGTARIHYPDTGRSVILHESEFIMNYRDRPHVVSNPGDETLILLFACCADR